MRWFVNCSDSRNNLTLTPKSLFFQCLWPMQARSTKIVLKTLFLCMLAGVSGKNAHAQRLNYSVLSPEANGVVGADNLFVAVTLNDRKFENDDVKVLIDKSYIDVAVKINENKLSFMYYGILADGKHRIDIWARVTGERSLKLLTWNFYVNVK